MDPVVPQSPNRAMKISQKGTKEKSMRTKVGLWIDHRKALIVAVTDKGEEIRLIISRIEKQLSRSGGIRSTAPYESQLVPADDSRERRSKGLLNIYPVRNNALLIFSGVTF
jgi:hypothetical protein